MRNIHKIGENIYITNDEKIKRSDYVLYLEDNSVLKVNSLEDELNEECDYFKKIILTNDPELKIQIIDDEFLEWFVKNPNCEEVEVVKDKFFESVNYHFYKTIIPKEESLEESAERLVSKSSITESVKWQQERSYSEEEVIEINLAYSQYLGRNQGVWVNFKEWFKQFKKQVK